MHSAAASLANSITHAKFEATDNASDEAVLLTILQLFETLVSSEFGSFNLDDKAICSIIEAAFSMSFQGRTIGKVIRNSITLRNITNICKKNSHRRHRMRLQATRRIIKKQKRPNNFKFSNIQTFWLCFNNRNIACTHITY